MRNNCRNSSNSWQTVCYCSQYQDMPMNIYYGPGYTAEDSLISIQESLEQISATLTCLCRRMG